MLKNFSPYYVLTGSFFLFFLVPAIVFSQVKKSDTAFLTTAQHHTRQLYLTAIGGQAKLYNGIAYQEYVPREDEYPYFGNGDWTLGAISYGGEKFENIPILFDISKDKVIIEHFYNGAKVELVSEKVNEFTINDHTFIRIQKDTAHSIEGGFYDLLYNGKIKVLAKRKKNLQESVTSGHLEAEFEEVNHYFIYKNGIYFSVKSKGSVLEVLKDQKSG